MSRVRHDEGFDITWIDVSREQEKEDCFISRVTFYGQDRSREVLGILVYFFEQY